jgi:enoyl-CoA hydratase/carnithine racemase
VFEELTYETDDGVARITFNRPERRNALGPRGYEELIEALQRAGSDPSAGVIVIAGNGKSFCAGGDIEMAQTMLTDEAAARHHFFRRMIEAGRWVMDVGKPVVCGVHGACVGGGAELVTFADYVIAEESAFFLYAGTKIGGAAWWGACQLLPLQVGMRRAEEILFHNERVYGTQAVELGLINRVVPDGTLSAAVDDECQRLLDLSEEGLRLTKAALRPTKELLLSSMSAVAELAAAGMAKPDIHDAFDAQQRGEAFSWRALRARRSNANSNSGNDQGDS